MSAIGRTNCTAMATVISRMLFVFFIIISIPCISAVNNPKGFSTKLIHRNSPLSPYRNLQTDEEDNLFDDRALKSSLRRHAYLSAKQQNDQPNDFYGFEFPDGTGYIAVLSIGTPAMNVYPMLDTASDLFWIQCAPCVVCYEQRDPIYNRSASDSFIDLPCENSLCSELGPRGTGCNQEDKCTYNLLYVDGSRSSGFLGAEIINFTSFAVNAETFAPVVFGCGTENLNNVKGYKLDGVMGLGASNLSFFSQLVNDTERKFSYCFGNISNSTDQGELKIGENAFIFGDETPLEVSLGLYYVNLTGIGIGVGQPMLPINWDSSFQKQPDGTGGVIIDSGSTLTHLEQEAYDTFKKAVLDELRINHNIYPVILGTYRECFAGRMASDLVGFPKVILYFEGLDNKLELDIWSTFQQLKSDGNGDQFYCLSFTASPNELNVIGNLAQQFHNIGYDLENNIISFHRMGCELI